jgi:hypothetical protein
MTYQLFKALQLLLIRPQFTLDAFQIVIETPLIDDAVGFIENGYYAVV